MGKTVTEVAFRYYRENETPDQRYWRLFGIYDFTGRLCPCSLRETEDHIDVCPRKYATGKEWLESLAEFSGAFEEEDFWLDDVRARVLKEVQEQLWEKP